MCHLSPPQGLWLTGQDALMIGVPLAQLAGLLTALRVLGPRGAARLVARGAWLLVVSYAAPSTAPDDGDSQ